MDNSFAIIVILVIGINATWYSAKFFIRANGLKSYMWWKHFQDFSSLYKLTSKEYPEHVNKKAKLYLFGIPLSLIVFLGMFFSFAGSNV